MSLLSNSNAIPSTGEAYTITDSLRFRKGASAYLNWTPASAGNQKTWTWSGWVKRGDLTGNQALFTSDISTAGSGTYALIRFVAGQLAYFDYNNGTMNHQSICTGLFRDPSAWYHIIVAVDTTQATGSNRCKIYVNGVEQLKTDTHTFAQNANGYINNNNKHYLGTAQIGTSNQYFDGYMTEVHFVDGQALDPTDFGETNSDGVWQPIEYTGTHGTNGFYLNFSDGTSTTTLGYDNSSNSNNWTLNNFNISLSPLSTAQNYDIMSDVPTLTDEDTGNFPTYNVLFPLSSSILQSGNQKLSNGSTSSWRHAISSIALPKTGKWYFEMVANVDTNNGSMGIAPVESLANGSNGYVTDAILTNTPNSSGTAYGGLAGSTGAWTGTYNISAYDALACAVDMDNNKVWFRIGTNWVDAGSGAGDPSAGTNPAVSGGINSNKTYHFVTSAYAQNHWVNFGQRPFQYTVPTGFKKLNTYNLPDSDITDGSDYFITNTFTGTGATLSIDTGFSPDFVWLKSRSFADHPLIYDTIRGANQRLYSSLTNAESTANNQLNSFDSTGYTLGSDPSGQINVSGQTSVGWSWRGSDSTAVSNTNGTITSTVSANTTSGFSVVTFTGNGLANQTVGHGLGVTPAMVIQKSRTTGTTGWDWLTYHKGLPTPSTDYILLNQTAAKATASGLWNHNATTLGYPTSYSTSTGSGQDFVAYCFAEVEGFSKFGSYTGNGSTDGTFVYTGFRPAFVMIKRTDAAQNWVIIDSVRKGYNQVVTFLLPNSSIAEYDGAIASSGFDLLSNGFKLKATTGGANDNGGTFIYMAFAENPFKNSLAR